MTKGQTNLVQAFVDVWPGHVETVLDVGCGDGKVTAAIASRVPGRFVGLDSSAQALTRIALPCILGDATRLPFEDGAFDLVMSSDTLEHLPEASYPDAWCELFRVAGKYVMVAVPLREELLDATTRCLACLRTYHVNWHQRAHDLDDIFGCAAKGWQVQYSVASGESWSERHPLETAFRRYARNEWAAWRDSVCPFCGAKGHDPAPDGPLSHLAGLALGQEIYHALAHSRVWRSKSEILVLFSRSPVASPQLTAPLVIERFASEYAPNVQGSAANLTSYPQVARSAAGLDADLVIQFPVYGEPEVLVVTRSAASPGDAVEASLEDGIGLVFSGRLLDPAQNFKQIALPRPIRPGVYGVLVRTRHAAHIDAMRLGESPLVRWLASGEHSKPTYYRTNAEPALFIQVDGECWYDESFLSAPSLPRDTIVPSVIAALETQASAAIEHAQQRQAERHELADLRRECEALRVTIQNMTAEKSALQSQAARINALEVEIQNLTSRNAVLSGREKEADRLIVDLQNLRAELEILRERAALAESLQVRVQNLEAERTALLGRVREGESFAVQVENLSAERISLLQRAGEADKLAVDVQNLHAETTLLRERAMLAENLQVKVQNLEAERDALLGRVREGESFAVQVENLTAERNSLLRRAGEADRLAVHVQNLTAERDALQTRVIEAEALEVRQQNLAAERDQLLERAKEADRIAVTVQNLAAERDHFRAQAEEVGRLEAESRDLLSQVADLNGVIEGLRKRLETSDQEIDDARQRHRGLLSEMAALRQQLQLELDRVNALQLTLAEAQKQREQQQAELQATQLRVEARVGEALRNLGKALRRRAGEG